MQPNATDWDVYINFVILAVTGNTGAADNLMVRFGDAMSRCGLWLGKTIKEPTPPVFRGVLIEPDVLIGDYLHHQDGREFLSWTEDLDCALWFAHREAIISGPLIDLRPDAKGYLLLLRHPKPEWVLFRHNWKNRIEAVTGVDLHSAAALHPQADPDQFMWNLKTQNEVITCPLGSFPTLDANAIQSLDIAELDKRYCYPPVLKGAP